MRKVAFLIAAVLAFSSTAAAQDAMVDGQVTKVDQAQGKITLRHAPIAKLDMDAMTMVFRVKDPAMLKGIKAGDKVKFEADRVNGLITIIKMQKSK